jgi:hypothetical protein
MACFSDLGMTYFGGLGMACFGGLMRHDRALEAREGGRKFGGANGDPV